MADKPPTCAECKHEVREHRPVAGSSFKFCQGCYELCLTEFMPAGQAAAIRAKRAKRPTPGRAS